MADKMITIKNKEISEATAVKALEEYGISFEEKRYFPGTVFMKGDYKFLLIYDHAGRGMNLLCLNPSEFSKQEFSTYGSNPVKMSCLEAHEKGVTMEQLCSSFCSNFVLIF